jgi:integrase
MTSIVVMALRDLLSVYATRHALSPRSVTLYTGSIDRLEAFLKRASTLDDFDDLTLAKFAEWRRTDNHYRGKPPRPATVKKDIAQLVSLWNHAAKKRMTRSDGTMIEYPDLPRGLVKVALRPPKAYTLEEVDALIRTCRARKGMIGPVPAWWLWETLLTTAWQTAERIGGLLALRWRDVDLDARLVTFDGESRKGGTKTIIRSITPDLAKMLSLHRRGDDDLVWPWAEHRRRTALWRSLQILGDRAGVQTRGFHSIRKASGSYVAAAGGDATEYLSHSDSKTTREHYLDRRIVGGADPLDLLPALPSERRAKPKQPAPTPPPAAAVEPVEAGRRVGASMAARGLGCPPRGQHDALAAAAGIEPDDVAAFSGGLIEGWLAGQGDAA